MKIRSDKPWYKIQYNCFTGHQCLVTPRSISSEIYKTFSTSKMASRRSKRNLSYCETVKTYLFKWYRLTRPKVESRWSKTTRTRVKQNISVCKTSISRKQGLDKTQSSTNVIYLDHTMYSQNWDELRWHVAITNRVQNKRIQRENTKQELSKHKKIEVDWKLKKDME